MLTRLRKDAEDGVVLVTVLLLTMIMLILVASTLAYSLGSQNISRRDQDFSSALAAAEAGLDDYLFRLNENDQYYQYNALNPPPAAPAGDGNQAFNTWVSVPDSGATSVTCVASADSNIPCFRYAVDTSSLLSQGAIIVTSTGRSRTVARTIQATLRRRAFIDYLYFTDYETMDPALYTGSPFTATEAQASCAKHYYEGRDPACTEINFVSVDTINGPLHSNDAILICGSPDFNGDVTTSWQGSGSPVQRWRGNTSCSNSPTFSRPGDPQYADPLTMPPNNVAIKVEADGAATPPGTGCLYTGPTSITLNAGGTMTVVSPRTLSTNANCLGSNKPLPANGVIYVQNVPSTGPNSMSTCPTSPQLGSSSSTVDHPLGYPQLYDINTYGCENGDVFLKGTLEGRLTIAADNNIDIIDDVTYSTGIGGSDLLGLVANNYVEIYHPVGDSATPNNFCHGGFVNNHCNLKSVGGSSSGFMNPEVDAAILSVQHSFRVQSYAYGDNNLGSITINGAIAQRYRGIVGTSSGGQVRTGYGKDYNYDTRLKYESPPHFLNPIAAAWQIVTWIEPPAAYAWNAP